MAAGRIEDERAQENGTHALYHLARGWAGEETRGDVGWAGGEMCGAWRRGT